MKDQKDNGTSLTEGAAVSVSASASATARHTDGPWHVWDVFIEDTLGNTVAEAWERYDSDDMPNTITAEANAHLIAAAPEMKDALHGVTPLCDVLNELMADSDDMRARVMGLLIKHGLRDDYGFLVANALAKAEGRS